MTTTDAMLIAGSVAASESLALEDDGRGGALALVGFAEGAAEELLPMKAPRKLPNSFRLLLLLALALLLLPLLLALVPLLTEEVAGSLGAT